MNALTHRVRRLATALGVAALLSVAGCDDSPGAPPSDERPEIPTLEMTSTDAP